MEESEWELWLSSHSSRSCYSQDGNSSFERKLHDSVWRVPKEENDFEKIDFVFVFALGFAARPPANDEEHVIVSNFSFPPLKLSRTHDVSFDLGKFSFQRSNLWWKRFFSATWSTKPERATEIESDFPSLFSSPRCVFFSENLGLEKPTAKNMEIYVLLGWSLLMHETQQRKVQSLCANWTNQRNFKREGKLDKKG